MVAETKKRSRRARRKAEEEEEGASEGASVVAPVAPVSPALRDELTEAITELIFDAQDVGFCLATLECDKRSECELVKKSKNLVLKVRRLFELQRRMARERRATSPPPTAYA